MVDPIDEVRALLPIWVGWLGPVSMLLGASLLSWALARLSTSVVLRDFDPSAHWTERARIGFVGRGLSGMLVGTQPLLFALVAYVLTGPLWVGSPLTSAALTALGALGGTSLAHAGVLRRVLRERPSVRETLRSTFVALLVVRPMLLLLAVFALTAPPELVSPATLIWLLAFVGCVVLAMRGDTLHLARLLGLARPADAELERATLEVGALAGVTRAKVWLTPLWSVNAFAFPLGGKIVFTERARRLLDLDALRSIAAHEVGHLVEPKAVKVLRLGSALLVVPLGSSWPIFDRFGLAVLGVWLGVAVVWVLMVRLQRRMEERADRHAVERAGGTAGEGGDDARRFAETLAQIYELNEIPAVMPPRSVHPNLYDRMAAAGTPPRFPRPKPPPMRRASIAFVVLAFAISGLLLGADLARQHTLAELDVDDRGAMLYGLALGSDGVWELMVLAERAPDVEDSLVFHRAALALARTPLEQDARRLRLVEVLSDLDRCDEARGLLAQVSPPHPSASDPEGVAQLERAWIDAVASHAEHCMPTSDD